jgi:hypothetical protein
MIMGADMSANGISSFSVVLLFGGAAILTSGLAAYLKGR